MSNKPKANPASHAKLTVKTMALSALKPHAQNPRNHPKPGSEDWNALKRSLADSYFDPIVVNTRGDLKNVLVSGHLRTKVLMEAGVTKADCVIVDFDEKKHVEVMLRANTNSADWDNTALSEILKTMTADEKLLAGFNADDLKGLETSLEDVLNGKAKDPTSDAKEIELQALVKKWGVEAGQLWHLGDHRLVVGSATDPKAWKRLMAGDKANLVFCDPPYGVSYESDATGKIQNDDLRQNALTGLLKPAFEQMAANADDNAAFYIWHASSTRRDFEWALNAAAIEENQYLTWVKDSFVMGRADYHWATEPAFYCSKAGHRAAFYGDRKQSTVWRISRLDPGDQATVNLANGLHISNCDKDSLYIKPRTAKGTKLRHIRLNHGDTVMVAQTATTDAWEVKRDNAQEMMHPNQKPPELALRAIFNSTAAKGAIVADCFAGSGSTMIACERSGRRGRFIELDPKFAALIIERYHKESGNFPLSDEVKLVTP